MEPRISPAVAIAMAGLKGYAVGDTIEQRFKAVITPERISDACFMTTNEDEQFRAAVGAVMLSYGPDTPEFARIEEEMRRVMQLSALINAAQAGLNVSAPEPEEDHVAIGLLGMWHEREKR